MQEAVNSEMLWLTKCQKKSEVCSHLLTQAKALGFQRGRRPQIRSGLPSIFIHTVCEVTCAQTVGRVAHMCLLMIVCTYFHKIIPFMSVCLLSQFDIPQPFKPVVRDKIEMLTCFLIHVCRSASQKSCDWNWQICHLSVVNKTSSSGDYTVVGATAHLWERCFLLEAKARPLWISWTWISCLYTTGDIILSDICVTASTQVKYKYKHNTELMWKRHVSGSTLHAHKEKLSL